MTQAELAGTQASVAYISRIEAGQRRPSARLLETIAQRLDVTVDDLCAPEQDLHSDLRVELGVAEHHLERGSHVLALRIATEVTKTADARGLNNLGDQATIIAASACFVLAGPAVAVTRLVRRFGDDASTIHSVKAISMLVQGHLSLDDYASALVYADKGERLVDEYLLGGLPEALELALHHARTLIKVERPQEAAKRCEEALAQAERVTSPADLADAYWRASARESAAGVLGPAAIHAEFAEVARAIDQRRAYRDPLRAELERARTAANS